MSIWVQRSASIRPRTSLLKFGGRIVHVFIRLLRKSAAGCAAGSLSCCAAGCAAGCSGIAMQLAVQLAAQMAARRTGQDMIEADNLTGTGETGYKCTAGCALCAAGSAAR